jgi:hypothetical protein
VYARSARARALTGASQDEWQHARQAKEIVETVLKNMDKDGDEQVSLAEFEEAGLEGLPNFEDLGAHGHHYDVESGTCASHPMHSTSHLRSYLQSSSSITKVRSRHASHMQRDMTR